MAYREDTQQVQAEMLTALQVRDVPQDFLALLEELIANGRMHDPEAIEEALHRWMAEEGEA